MHLNVSKANVLSLPKLRVGKLAVLKSSSIEASKLSKATFSPLYCIFSSFSMLTFAVFLT